ncbi:MAG TPA: hypothetical protein VHE99_06025 [Gammaproteobacteria bacterium]|nr:hypothetical protein [Gammaproteobacteria bacterium]
MTQPRADSTYSDVTQELNPGMTNSAIAKGIQLEQEALNGRQKWQQATSAPVETLELEVQEESREALFQRSKAEFIASLEAKELSTAKRQLALLAGLSALNHIFQEADFDDAEAVGDDIAELAYEAAQNANEDELECLAEDELYDWLEEGVGDSDLLTEAQRIARSIQKDFFESHDAESSYSPSF